MNLQHFSGKTMPDISTLDATLFPVFSVYTKEFGAHSLD
jgi:hypothetical protein